MHVKQFGFICSSCGTFTQNKYMTSVSKNVYIDKLHDSQEIPQYIYKLW